MHEAPWAVTLEAIATIPPVAHSFFPSAASPAALTNVNPLACLHNFKAFFLILFSQGALHSQTLVLFLIP